MTSANTYGILKNLLDAIACHAEQLRGVADHLQAIQAELKDFRKLSGVQIDADTHSIVISGPDALIDRLVAKDLAELWQDEDEE
jgi:hypothetical protein